MKVMLCSRALTWAREAVEITNESGAAIVYKTSARNHSDGVHFANADSMFAYNIAMVMGDLMRNKVSYDNYGDHEKALLLAYDMPILGSYWESQPFVSHDMYGRARGGEISAQAWDVCKGMAVAAYSTVNFDYIFVFDDGPSMDMLVRNGLTATGSNVMKVGSWREAVAVLKAGD